MSAWFPTRLDCEKIIRPKPPYSKDRYLLLSFFVIVARPLVTLTLLVLCCGCLSNGHRRVASVLLPCDANCVFNDYHPRREENEGYVFTGICLSNSGEGGDTKCIMGLVTWSGGRWPGPGGMAPPAKGQRSTTSPCPGSKVNHLQCLNPWMSGNYLIWATSFLHENTCSTSILYRDRW